MGKTKDMSHTTRLQSTFDTDNVISSEIKEMVKEKGNTCISIVIPTHRLGQDRQGDSKEIQKAILAAKESVSIQSRDSLFGIEDLVEQIDFNRNKDGIGVFVSPHIKKLVKFPFPVSKKIIVNKLFHLHDLLYLENYSATYYLLDISKKENRLFRGAMDQLEEIRDENFPREITEEYEYNKPSPSSSSAGYAHVKGFEKDKTEVQQIRLKSVFHDLDKSLVKYLVTKEVPLILCGPERDISLFKSVTNHLDNIAASITDNQQRSSMHDKEISAWLQIKAFIDRQKLKLIDEFKEKVGAGLAVYGIEEVWKAANEGKGLKMLVEKDYNRSEFVMQEEDAVNEIMMTVLEKNGKVIIVEKDALRDYKRIALITRY